MWCSSVCCSSTSEIKAEPSVATGLSGHNELGDACNLFHSAAPKTTKIRYLPGVFSGKSYRGVPMYSYDKGQGFSPLW